MKRRMPYEHKSGLSSFGIICGHKGKDLNWVLNLIKESDNGAISPFIGIFSKRVLDLRSIGMNLLMGPKTALSFL